jgi:hypothetical protein
MPPKQHHLKRAKRKKPSGPRKKKEAPTADASQDSDANANEEGKMEEEDEGDEGKEADEGTSFNNNDK